VTGDRGLIDDEPRTDHRQRYKEPIRNGPGSRPERVARGNDSRRVQRRRHGYRFSAGKGAHERTGLISLVTPCQTPAVSRMPTARLD
jgi:hypothetical protein